MQFLLTYILFHVYLLYATLYGVTQLIVHHTRIKGSHIIPMLPSVAHCKEKVIMFVTSIFVWHWFSRSVLGISAGWEYVTSWVVNLRPQINIKPQLKLVNASDSCHSNKSNLSINMEEVKADVDVFLSPEKEEFAELMKGFQRATDTASFASDLVSSVAASITPSDSVESLGAWSSSGILEDQDEVDLDAEFDKACLLQVSGSGGFRSRIPRPQAVERFRIRNAIANSQLRQRFLRRNPPSDNEEANPRSVTMLLEIVV
ncbi:hypothetical protein COOONC_23072 [Cooperia oncophora]